ncbi:MAG TPA: hypothetical protein VM328_02860 [Fimbriimonadaceae bacterium]|nr:hypothetical protein [Fimbriimonadaceae bacterium]
MKVLCLTTTLAVAAMAVANFSKEERLRAMSYWNEPGRYRVGAPAAAAKDGPWQVRLTPEGSTWLWNYNQARGLAKGPPTADAPPLSEEQKSWEAWIDRKVARDRWLAGVAAARANSEALGRVFPEPAPIPEDPGPIPDGLYKLAGNPPPFAGAVAPMQHTIRFDDGVELSYSDNVPMRVRYAYYRFPKGVMSAGAAVRSLPAAELDRLFTKAGVTPPEARVMRSVSLLEGGFDSVNTYDTGFVSVGFIQFACLKDGAGSLGSLLLKMKSQTPQAFQEDFKRFGLDVSPEGALVALDLSTGVETIGADAAQTIIADKRLIAVFQRAGLKSEPFRVAQIAVAKEQYYPADDVVPVAFGSNIVLVKVRDVVRSEAGMSTLMDRKVNTGKIDLLAAVLSEIVAENRLRDPKELARFEHDIIVAMRFRKDYLADASLSQPPARVHPARVYSGSTLSRSGGRGSRGGG